MSDIAGEHLRLQAVFTVLSIAMGCFALADDLFENKLAWLRALVTWSRHILGMR